MITPLDISFIGLDKSPAIEARIAERAAKLEKHFDRITHCRVVVAAPHKHSHKGKSYEIRIDIGLPGTAPLIVTHEAAVAQAQEDLKIALRDAFDAVDRRLNELIEKKTTAARVESKRRRPAKAISEV